MEGQRIFTSFINIFVYFIPKQWFSRFLKTFIRLLPKLSAICTLRLCRSLCLRHLREIVFILSPPCSPTLCVTLICSKLTLSLQIPEEPLLASKRCLIGLQKTPFKPLTNALLKSNQAPFLIPLYN